MRNQIHGHWQSNEFHVLMICKRLELTDRSYIFSCCLFSLISLMQFLFLFSMEIVYHKWQLQTQSVPIKSFNSGHHQLELHLIFLPSVSTRSDRREKPCCPMKCKVLFQKAHGSPVKRFTGVHLVCPFCQKKCTDSSELIVHWQQEHDQMEPSLEILLCQFQIILSLLVPFTFVFLSGQWVASTPYWIAIMLWRRSWNADFKSCDEDSYTVQQCSVCHISTNRQRDFSFFFPQLHLKS